MELRENITGAKAKYRTDFSYEILPDRVVFRFDAHHTTYNSYSDRYNDDIYNGDVVEVFLDVGVTNHYYEIEVAPNGTLFLADITNDGKGFSGIRLEKCFVSAEVTKTADGYIAAISVPLREIGYRKEKGIRFNAYRIETEGIAPNQNLFALSPTLCGTFHRKESFIPLK